MFVVFARAKRQGVSLSIILVLMALFPAPAKPVRLIVLLILFLALALAAIQLVIGALDIPHLMLQGRPLTRTALLLPRQKAVLAALLGSTLTEVGPVLQSLLATVQSLRQAPFLLLASRIANLKHPLPPFTTFLMLPRILSLLVEQRPLKLLPPFLLADLGLLARIVVTWSPLLRLTIAICSRTVLLQQAMFVSPFVVLRTTQAQMFMSLHLGRLTPTLPAPAASLVLFSRQSIALTAGTGTPLGATLLDVLAIPLVLTLKSNALVGEKAFLPVSLQPPPTIMSLTLVHALLSVVKVGTMSMFTVRVTESIFVRSPLVPPRPTSEPSSLRSARPPVV